ncbi:MAG: hypothetical protein A2622_14305 [Bdellovibrionales bacterium RIFCSPHIGHO2_01_FULL_40_29]|nr:MAG: hypothetical protein A2622_14305 [Bdellovibrionales bacterium RIFCSPHIGHO2_01_FULL_40_29]OFZ33691.1 MAG: hypothetical protein A3D17_11915 [Bdellovibrionales bacterium RIFCSPHIGHO2_02_FULL_40_15]
MKKLFLITLSILSFTLLINPHGQAYEQNFGFDTINTCTSYEYIDTHLNCGEKSYLQHFAIPYCNKYLRKNEIFSDRAQVILANIRSCLQMELLARANSDLNCENIEEIGVESHYGCYLESGFCDLPEVDNLKVMWIARLEVFNVKVMSVFSKVVAECRIRE